MKIIRLDEQIINYPNRNGEVITMPVWINCLKPIPYTYIKCNCSFSQMIILQLGLNKDFYTLQ